MTRSIPWTPPPEVTEIDSHTYLIETDDLTGLLDLHGDGTATFRDHHVRLREDDSAYPFSYWNRTNTDLKNGYHVTHLESVDDVPVYVINRNGTPDFRNTSPYCPFEVEAQDLTRAEAVDWVTVSRAVRAAGKTIAHLKDAVNGSHKYFGVKARTETLPSELLRKVTREVVIGPFTTSPHRKHLPGFGLQGFGALSGTGLVDDHAAHLAAAITVGGVLTPYEFSPDGPFRDNMKRLTDLVLSVEEHLLANGRSTRALPQTLRYAVGEAKAARRRECEFLDMSVVSVDRAREFALLRDDLPDMPDELVEALMGGDTP